MSIISFSNIYVYNLYLLSSCCLLLLVIWTLIVKRTSEEKPFLLKGISILLAIISLCGILFLTVISRTSSETHQFAFFAPYTNEFFREMFMNALLYFPLGLTLSVIIGPWAILVAFLLSLGIESWQYIAGTGVAQGTDVICNTLGCTIGAIPSWLYWRCSISVEQH